MSQLRDLVSYFRDLSSDAVANGIAFAGVLLALTGIIVGLVSVRFQVRRQWLLSSAQMVTAFEERFVSPEWKAYRAGCGRKVEQHWRGESLTLAEDFEVLGMFEHMSLLVRRKVLDFEMVWSKFGWYFVRYYEGLAYGPSNAIAEIRNAEGDDTLWEEFEWLALRSIDEYRRRGARLPESDRSRRVVELVRQEVNLIVRSEIPQTESAPVTAQQHCPFWKNWRFPW